MDRELYIRYGVVVGILVSDDCLWMFDKGFGME